MTTRAATDNEVALWHCPECCRSGALMMDPHADVYTVVNALEDAHREVSPECKVIVGGLRMTRPNDWFRSITDLARQFVARKTAGES